MRKTTGSLSKRLFCKPDVTPFCGIMVAIVFAFALVQVPGLVRPSFFDYPETEHADFGFYEGVIPLEINVFSSGKVAFAERIIDNPNRLHELIKEKSTGLKSERIILFKADRNAPFGKVQEILRQIKKAGIDQVGLGAYKIFPEHR